MPTDTGPRYVWDLPTRPALNDPGFFADWRHVPGRGWVGPDARLEDDWDRLPTWAEFVENVRADLKRRCRLAGRRN